MEFVVKKLRRKHRVPNPAAVLYHLEWKTLSGMQHEVSNHLKKSKYQCIGRAVKKFKKFKKFIIIALVFILI